MFHALRRRLAAFRVPGTLAVALACGIAQPAAALVAAPPEGALQLDVFRDGNANDWLLGNHRWLSDSFDNGNPTAGPAGVSYTLNGLANGADAALAATEQNGALQLNGAYGALSPNAAGQMGRSLRLRLATDTAGDTGLSRAHSFAAVLYLSLSGLPALGESFGIRLSDGFSNGNDYIELYVGGNNAGNDIVFRKQDFLTHQITARTSVPVLGRAGAESLVLVLSHDEADTDGINALYGYADANGSLLGDVTYINGTQAFHGETTTLLELRASSTLPVPEPGTWALMAAGLGLLGSRLKRQR